MNRQERRRERALLRKKPQVKKKAKVKRDTEKLMPVKIRNKFPIYHP